MRRARPRRRRGVMLFAVIVVLAVAALAVGALSVAQEAEHAGQVASEDRTQQRAYAWSGAQAVAAALAAQREQIAAGEAPELPAEIVLWEADGRAAVVRLLPVGPLGELAVSEIAKRSLSTLTADELALSGVVSGKVAEAAIARRDRSDSIEALVEPSVGLSPSVVLGPVASSIATAVRAAQEGDRSSPEGVARPLAIADVVTPFEAQRALGESGPAGLAPRKLLTGEWSDELVKLFDEQTAGGTAQRVRDALDGRVPADEGELVTALAKAKVDPKQWSAVLDAFICSAEPIETGRVDLGRASEAVLRTLPGIKPESAARIVQERLSLDAAERTQLAWPVVHSLLTAEEFAQLAPHICARSWLWRLRLATGTKDHLQETDALEGVQVWDVVLDLSESPPRFAALRDCTLLPVVAALAAQAAREPDPNDTPRLRREREARQLDADSAAQKSASTGATEFGDSGSDDGSKPEFEGAGAASAPKDEPASEITPSWASSRQPVSLFKRSWARPSTGTSSASPGDADGKRASDAPPAHTSAGGLSGRWRTRGSQP